jgi:membrane protease YdiL (CAAX protease family)
MKKAVTVVIIYILVMAGGLYYVKNFKNTGYSDPGFLNHFIWILLGLAIVMTIYCLVFRRDTALEFRGRKNWVAYTWIMIPIFIVLGISIAMTFKPTWAFFLPFVATLFVGIAEELAFRKVMFGALLKRSAEKGGFVVKPVLISAVVFSLLHAVNILGGQSVSAVGMQLLLTFLAGIVFAVVYMRTQSLLAIIVFHWLWDALTFMGMEKQFKVFAIIMVALTLVQVIIGLAVLRKYKGVKAREVVGN